MAYRNKVFISFDGDNDIHYYRLMRAWKQNDNTNFDFFDAHEFNTARDSSLESTVKRKLRERLLNAKIFVSLIGAHTRYLHKFVRWELQQGLDMNLPLIGVNLNDARSQDPNRCPPVIRDALVVYIIFKKSILQHALENWPEEYYRLRKNGVTGPRYYNDSVYRKFDL